VHDRESPSSTLDPSDRGAFDPFDRGALDPSKPHISRVYDYLLGGKDNFAADRTIGDQIIGSLPTVQLGVRAQRALLGRVVRYLVGEVSIEQLIDIGSGLPTADNVHEVAHQLDPRTRVVYVDNDPVVLAHARTLVLVAEWRPDAHTPNASDFPVLRLACAGVARKP